MALRQAHEVRDRLAAAHKRLAEPNAVEIMPIKTTGDKIQDRSLAEIGGKGLFVKEIDEALFERRIDLAVHSVKDIPTWLPDGLALACFLERGDPRDAFVSFNAADFGDLPANATIGTSSLRRQAQVLNRWPNLKVRPIRGNADTRIRKVAEGQFDATLLGFAGLRRIGREDAARRLLSPEEMLPAAGQGAIGVEIRAGDDGAHAWLEPINHAETASRIAAERALLDELQGSCRTPIAGLAEIDSTGMLTLRALVALPDGSVLHRATQTGPRADAIDIGKAAGRALKALGGTAFFDAIR